MLDDSMDHKIEVHTITDRTAKQPADFILNLDRRRTLGRSLPRKGEASVGVGSCCRQQGEERQQGGPMVLRKTHAHRRTIDRTICEEPGLV